MNADEVLKLAEQHGLRLQPQGDSLAIEYPESSPPPSGLFDLLRQHKAELLALLTKPQPVQYAANDTGAHVLTTNQARALTAVRMSLERKREILARRGYPVSNARLKVSDWHKRVMNRLQVNHDDMRNIERALIDCGLIKIDRPHVELSDGVPLPKRQQVDNEGLAWGGGDGRHFVSWLYS